jgi:hypothetical protein
MVANVLLHKLCCARYTEAGASSKHAPHPLLGNEFSAQPPQRKCFWARRSTQSRTLRCLRRRDCVPPRSRQHHRPPSSIPDGERSNQKFGELDGFWAHTDSTIKAFAGTSTLERSGVSRGRRTGAKPKRVVMPGSGYAVSILKPSKRAFGRRVACSAPPGPESNIDAQRSLKACVDRAHATADRTAASAAGCG